MDTKKKYIIAGVSAAALMAGIIFFASGSSDKNLSLIDKLMKNPATRGIDEAAVSRFAQNPEIAFDSDDKMDYEQKIAFLRHRFGKNIAHSKMQIALIETLWRHCSKKHPDAWIECVQEFLYAAFPDRAASIFKLFEKYYKYQTWLGEENESLNGLSDADRKRKLWEKRKALFGQDAAEEIWASEIRNDKITDSLEKIDRMEGKTVKDKIQTYKQSLSDVYSGGDEKIVERRQQEFMDKFLNLESVQGQLDTMPAEERRENLRDIRKEMGMKEDALARWDELDNVRDQRWSNAEKYQKDRESVEKNLKGEALERKLDELRTKYFGAEAETIKSEEQGGYFRYKEKRKWGQN